MLELITYFRDQKKNPNQRLFGHVLQIDFAKTSSTSLHTNAALSFSKGWLLVLDIADPKTKGIFLQQIPRLADFQFALEFEVLLQPHIWLKITAIEEKVLIESCSSLSRCRPFNPMKKREVTIVYANVYTGPPKT